ncbi:MAG: M48 family metallopeptidase [Gammaproteobacteria bacterium]|nr:M48 family metallopeptidase [Gammaproteobacteria bacterium]MCW8972800.1 M48 family metallopeptidase [Gammaproteobacteria bacterium]MCW8992127.1 M48 family metallopeptidase [Gammaproteobacteria bacterium]
MSEIRGELYDGQTSRHFPARLLVAADGELQFFWEGGSSSYLMGGVRVSSRLGNTPRYLTLPDGWKFETRDNDAVDSLLRQNRQHGWNAWLHKLESRWHYVVAALAFVVVFVWVMLQYGLPAAAEGIAYRLPATITDDVSEQTLGYLDKHLFAPSELPEAQQTRLQLRFAAMTSSLDSGHDFRLQFRKGGEALGANAFALPSGTIVMTDELVALSENENELAAILAHELGHVMYRHSLRQILQNSVLSLFITYTTGDASSLVVALPMMLVQLGYSRDFEREADRYAHDYMLENGIALEHFAHILSRIEVSHRERREEMKRRGERAKVFEYLSTHPDTGERVKLFMDEKR